MHLRILTMTLCLTIAGVATAAAPPNAAEYSVKAALLLKFAEMVELPADSPAAAEPAISICVLGENPFGDELARILEGKSVRGKPVVPLHVSRANQVRSCGVLFVSGDNAATVAKRFAKTPILTVGEAEGFATNGGIIAFVRDQGRIRFVVDEGAATAAGLKLDPQLAQFVGK